MKIRQGFVSNSSSSSFVIVGVSDKAIMREIASKDGKFLDGEYIDIDCGYGIDYSNPLNYYGYYNDPYYIGLDIYKKLEEKILPNLKKELQEKLKKDYNLEVPLHLIKFHYGEVGDG